MMKQIKITCKGHTNIPYKDLVPFQGSLKELSKQNYERLKKSILDLGFSEPCSVWHDGKSFKILNAHQRCRAIKQMVEQEGYECPPLPCNLIEARDEKEAKKKILALTSQYGEITHEGLYEFMNEAEIDFEEIESSFRFPEIDMDKFKAEFLSENKEDPALSDLEHVPFSNELDEKNDYIVLYFNSKEDFKEACDKLNISRVKYHLSPTQHEAFLHTGIGRVIEGKPVIDKL